MMSYRIYFVRGQNFVGFEDLVAEDDVQAVRAVAERSGEQACELWCGAKRIKRFPALPVRRPDDPCAVN